MLMPVGWPLVFGDTMEGTGGTSTNSNAVSNAVEESMAAALRSAGLGDMVGNVEVKQMGYSENVLERVISQHGITDREGFLACLLYTSPSPRDATLSRMPSSA